MEPPRTFFHRFDNGVTILFQEGSNGITPILPQESLFPSGDVGLQSELFLNLVKTYQESEAKIRERYPADLSAYKELNLSRLGLTQIPPQILPELKNVSSLNLSDNDLHFLPPHLQCLPLESLDISGNKKLQPNIPEWLGSMLKLHLIARDIGLNYFPEGFTEDRVSSDNEASLLFQRTQEVEEL